MSIIILVLAAIGAGSLMCSGILLVVVLRGEHQVSNVNRLERSFKK